MLSASHIRAYQHFLTLLTGFHDLLLKTDVKTNFSSINGEFQSLKQWFDGNIDNLDSQGIEAVIVSRWESIQREIKREFKLLSTDVLFLASARQNTTRNKRLQSIIDRINKLINYCQGLLKE